MKSLLPQRASLEKGELRRAWVAQGEEEGGREGGMEEGRKGGRERETQSPSRRVMHEAHQLGAVVHDYNPSIREVKTAAASLTPL